MTVGGVLSEANELYRRVFTRFFLTAAAVFVVLNLLTAIAADVSDDCSDAVAALWSLASLIALIVASLVDAGHSDFVVDRVRQAIDTDPRVAGPLALWGRRLMGEALSQAQRVAAERDSLAAHLAGGVDRPGLDLAALGRMFTRLTENHAHRMAELGLAS